METYYCLDCHHIAELDIHARCALCGSEAVVSTEASNLAAAAMLAEQEV